MVAYHYTGNSIPGSALKDVVLRIVHEATAIGLRIIAVTSDMGPSKKAVPRIWHLKYKVRRKPYRSSRT